MKAALALSMLMPSLYVFRHSVRDYDGRNSANAVTRELSAVKTAAISAQDGFFMVPLLTPCAN